MRSDNSVHLRQVILQLSSRVQMFKQRATDSWSFRCPICGDSKKSKTKARGSIYKNKKGNYSYYCFNNSECSKSVPQLLKEKFPDLYDEYRLSIFKDRTPTNIPREQFIPTSNKFDDTLLVPAADSEKASEYLESRKIPKEMWEYFSFTDKVASFINSNREDSKYENLKDIGNWIVAPIYNWTEVSGTKVVQSVCCRFIDSDPEKKHLRYIHAKFRDDCVEDQVVWGLDRIDREKPILCCEGIFDALFLDNSVALLTSVKTLKGYDDCNLIYVIDNEPRNKDICKIIERHILHNRTICLLPNSMLEYGKDINDYIKKGFTKEYLNDLILKHTYSGPRAILEFNGWKKI